MATTRTLSDICNDLIPYRKTNAGVRDRRLQESVKSFYEEKKLAEKALLEESVHDENIRRETLMGAASTKNLRSEREKTYRHQRQQILENARLAIIIESLTDIFYESIVLDDDYKLANRDILIETGNSLFVEGFEKELMNLYSLEYSESTTIQEFYSIANKYAEKIASSVNSDEITNLIDEAVGVIKESAGDDIRDIVREKVIEVVKVEQKIAQQNQEDLTQTIQEGFVATRKEKPTLFKSMMLGVSKLPISEDKSFLEGSTFETILAETIIHYTFLEVLNTSRIVEFNAKEAQKVASSYRFIK